MRASKFLPLILLIIALVMTACNNEQKENQTTNEQQNNTEENNNGETAQQEGATNENTDEATEEEQDNNEEVEDTVPQEGTASPENEVFKLTSPQLGAHVGKSFTIKGKAQVFEGQFTYRIEDENGTELSSDIVKVEASGEESETLWRDFQFQVNLQNTDAVEGNLILFTQSQKDGSAENELVIPLTFTTDE